MQFGVRQLQSGPQRLLLLIAVSILACTLSDVPPRPAKTPTTRPNIIMSKEGDYCLNADNVHLLTRLHVFARPYGDQLIAFSPDSQYLAIAVPGQVEFFHTGSLMPALSRLSCSQKGRCSIAFSPDGSRLLVDNFVYAFAPGKVTLESALPVDNHRVTAVAVSADGHYAAVAYEANSGNSPTSKIRIFRLADSLKVREIESGHSIITSLDFSPDGRLLASGSEGQHLTLWRVAEACLLSAEECLPRQQTLSQHWNPVRTIAFNHVLPHCNAASQSDYLASGGGEIWRLSEGKPTSDQPVYLGPNATALAFAPDGSLLALATSAAVYFYSVQQNFTSQTMNPVTVIPMHEGPSPTAIAFSPDGKLVVISRTAAGSQESVVELWGLPKEWPVETLLPCRDKVSLERPYTGRVVAISSNDAYIAAAEHEVVCLWSSNSGQQPIQLVHRAEVMAISFDQNDHLLATAAGNEVVLWDAQVPYSLRLMSIPHTKPVRAARFLTLNSRTVLATAAGNEIWFWDYLNGQAKPLDTIRSDSDILDIYVDRSLLTAAHADGRLTTWETAGGEVQLIESKGHASQDYYEAVAFATRNRALFLGSAAGIWHVNGNQSNRVQPRFFPGPPEAASFSSNDGWLAIATNCSILIWPPGQGQLTGNPGRVLQPQFDCLRAVTFYHEQNLAVTSSESGAVYVWRLNH